MAFIVIGHSFLHEVSKMPEEFELLELFPVFAISLGSSLCIVTFAGCIALIMESVIGIKLYAFVMTIQFILQMIFSSYFLSNQDIIDYKSKAIVVNVWNNRENGTEVLDNVQLIGQCCGLHSQDDYNGTEIPASCCGYDDIDEHCKPELAYQKGCASGFPEFYCNTIYWIIYYGYFIAGIELGAVAIAWFVEFDREDVIHKQTF